MSKKYKKVRKQYTRARRYEIFNLKTSNKTEIQNSLKEVLVWQQRHSQITVKDIVTLLPV